MRKGNPHKTLAERMAKYVTREGECLIWNGYFANQSSPSIEWYGKSTNVRRLVLLESTDNPSERAMIESRTMVPWVTCGNAMCVERSHMFMMPSGEYIRRIAPRNGPPLAAIEANRRRAIERQQEREAAAEKAKSDEAIHAEVRKALAEGTMAEQFVIRTSSIFNMGAGL